MKNGNMNYPSPIGFSTFNDVVLRRNCSMLRKRQTDKMIDWSCHCHIFCCHFRKHQPINKPNNTQILFRFTHSHTKISHSITIIAQTHRYIYCWLSATARVYVYERSSLVIRLIDAYDMRLQHERQKTKTKTEREEEQRSVLITDSPTNDWCDVVIGNTTHSEPRLHWAHASLLSGWGNASACVCPETSNKPAFFFQSFRRAAISV